MGLFTVVLLLFGFFSGPILGVYVPIFPNLPNAQTGTTPQPIIPSGDNNGATATGPVTGSILPAETFYYAVADSTAAVNQYLTIQYTESATSNGDHGTFWVLMSNIPNLVAAGGFPDGFPSASLNNYTCCGSCVIQLSCDYSNSVYFGINGGNVAAVYYNLQVYRGDISITPLLSGVNQTVYNAQRPTVSTNPVQAENQRLLNYNYYSIDVPSGNPGTYLSVDISVSGAAQDGVNVFLHYGRPGQSTADTGVIGVESHCSSKVCVNLAARPSQPYYVNPQSSLALVPCQCTPTAAGNYHCNITVAPCDISYGTWFIAVELPPRQFPTEPTDLSGRVNYTIQATVIHPILRHLENGVVYRGHVDPWAPAHYVVKVPFNDYVAGESRFRVRVSAIVGGTVDIWIHQEQSGLIDNLAGGPDGCVPANATCRACEACDLYIEKCYFTYGNWYISINVPYENGAFIIDNLVSLPVTYTVEASWDVDPVPVQIYAGTPVFGSVAAGQYNFFVVDIPRSIDTWFFAELYVKANNTEVIFAMLHGEIPGGECYAQPDFYCLTGDTRSLPYPSGSPGTEINGKFYPDDSGPPQFISVAQEHRESCTFMIQTCELQAGPLYLSVYGSHIDYTPYGDNTYYQIPVEYTLWVDFNVAAEVTSGIAYNEHVFMNQYQHYYIRADNVDQGSQLSIEVTNVQHGIPPTVEVYVNYNFLAGDCPCYDYLYNCTPPAQPCNSIVNPYDVPEYDIVNTVCAILVPACAFRPGVWYIGVKGINENLVEYTTPIGYVLAATILPAPAVDGVVLGQALPVVVPQWNITGTYSHFKIGASPVPLHDLEVQITFVQNCEGYTRFNSYGLNGEHIAAHPDVMRLFVFRNNIATGECWDYMCEATREGDSYCKIIIPHCQWTDDYYFVSIQGMYDGNGFDGRVTLRTSVRPVEVNPIVLGQSLIGHVQSGHYDHYSIELRPDHRQDLSISFFSNPDEDPVTMFLNLNTIAGTGPCFSYLEPYACTGVSCSWQIEACQLQRSIYYVSIYGGPTGQYDFQGQRGTVLNGGTRFSGYRDNWLDLQRDSANHHGFYEVGTHYTLLVQYHNVISTLFTGVPVMSTGWLNEVHHYRFISAKPILGEYLLFEVNNVMHGNVRAYVSYPVNSTTTGPLAGEYPCGNFDDTCIAVGANTCPNGVVTTGTPSWCQLRVPPCQLITGTYYFAVKVIATGGPANVAHTQVGYNVELDLIVSEVVDPVVAKGRVSADRLLQESVRNDRYIHYRFETDDSDYGNQIIVEIRNVVGGSLQVYYQNSAPADINEHCRLARICNLNPLGANRGCNWQVPYCLTRPGTHYVSVMGVTGRTNVTYDILIYKQKPLSVSPNQYFDPLDVSGTANAAQEVNVTHPFTNEPNGWAQFIRLPSVFTSDRAVEGDILEVFFYRLQNNQGVPILFNAYLWPAYPAGPRSCTPDCNRDQDAQGACQNFPCLTHVPTTSSTQNDDSVYSSLCNGGTGKGAQAGVPFPGPAIPCTLTVWSCDLAHFQPANQPKDWWLTVIPVGGDVKPTIPTLAGLSYSVTWRVRNIRQNYVPVPTIGTIISPMTSLELSSYVNKGNTPIFGTQGYQQWASYRLSVSVDTLNDQRTRLVIQTLFQNPNVEGAVYINPTVFASALGCNTYDCASNEACSGSYRYVNASCSLRTDIYYISVRNQDTSNGTIAYQFRITEYTESNVIPIRSDPTYNNRVSVSGTVAGENYDHYVLDVSSGDYNSYQGLNFVLTTSPTFGDNVVLYVRRGARAGAYRVSNEAAFDGEPEGCYTYQYSCNATATTDPGCCQVQIPHCQLLAGEWYFSVYNPSFSFDGIHTTSSYTLDVFFDLPAIPLTFSVPYNGVASSICGPMYFHHSVIVPENALNFDDRLIAQSYVTRWLRFQSSGFLFATANMYVNYGDVAGQGPESSINCLTNIGLDRNCESGGCLVDVDPCASASTGQKLVTGPYFVSVLVSTSTTYTILATIQQQVYLTISPAVYPTQRGDEGAVDAVYQAAPNTNDLQNWYYFMFDTANGPFQGDSDDDEISSASYMVGKLTVLDYFEDPIVKLNVWRDDCTQWECTINSNQGTCYIDALELAPCSVKGGRYYVRIENNVGQQPLNFLFTWYHNSTHQERLTLGVPFTQQIYSYEYHELFLEAAAVNEGCTLTVDISSYYGTVEAWIRNDRIAGPGPDASNIAQSCNIDYCGTTTTNAPADACGDFPYTCQLFLDTCTFQQRGYYVAIRGVVQQYPPVVTVPQTNVTNLEILYKVTAQQTCVTFTELIFGEPAVVTYNAPASAAPQQFYVDLESLNAGGLLRFVMEVPTQAFLSDKVATLHVRRNSSVGYTEQCPDTYATCSVFYVSGATQQDRICTIALDQCESLPGRYYIWADAPRGTIVEADVWDPVIKFLTPGEIYTNTINAPINYGNFIDRPYQPPFQYYRVDFDAKQRDFFLKLRLFNLHYNDQATAYVVSGQLPLPTSAIGNDVNDAGARHRCFPRFHTQCPNVASASQECVIEITHSNLPQTVLPQRYVDRPCEEGLVFRQGIADFDHVVKCGQAPPTYLYIVIQGVQQTCDLHAIEYCLEVQTKGHSDRLLAAVPYQSTVLQNNYQWYRLFPTSTPLVQNQVVKIDITNVPPEQAVTLLIQDGYLPTNGFTGVMTPYFPGGNLASATTVPAADGYGAASITYACRYGEFVGETQYSFYSRYDYNDDDNDKLFNDDDSTDDDDEGLYIGVYGDSAGSVAGSQIPFTLNTTLVPVYVFNLTDGLTVKSDDDDNTASVHYVDDDDDDVCPHKHDYYRFSPVGKKQLKVFIEVTIVSPGNFRGYLNKGGIADDQCTNTDFCDETTPDSDGLYRCQLHDFCNFEAGIDYYITVKSATNYSISARTVNNYGTVGLGETLSVALDGDQYRVFEIDVPEDALPPNPYEARLVVNVENAQYGTVSTWIRRGAVGGPRSSPVVSFEFSCGFFDSTGPRHSSSYEPGPNAAFTQSNVGACCIREGKYYLLVRANANLHSSRKVEFDISPSIYKYGLNPSPVGVQSHHSVSGVLDFYNVDRVNPSTPGRYAYYRLPLKFPNLNFTAFGEARLLNVQNGQLRLNAAKNRIATSAHAFFNGERTGLSYNGGVIVSGSRPYDNNQISTAFPGVPCQGCTEEDFCCSTGPTQTTNNAASSNDPFTFFTSCAFWIDPYSWATIHGDDEDKSEYGYMFFSVTPIAQDYEDKPITYSFRADEFRDFRLLKRNDPWFDSVHDGNWEYQFYSVVQPDQESVVIRTEVASGEGVLVNVYNSKSPDCATYQQQIWCSAQNSAEPWFCDIEIPTRAAHPGRDVRQFYISVFGKNATYGIAYYRGRDNCHAFSGSGTKDGLNFCKGLPYSVWAWDDYAQLDKQAQALFESYYQQFRVQPCWSGVTPECNDTLRRFACYENFHRCDGDGFEVGTCRKACNAVVYQCSNYFESVSLAHFNCTSSRYIEETLDATCTGNLEYNEYSTDGFLDNVDNILYSSVLVNSGISMYQPTLLSYLALILLSSLMIAFMN